MNIREGGVRFQVMKGLALTSQVNFYGLFVCFTAPVAALFLSSFSHFSLPQLLLLPGFSLLSINWIDIQVLLREKVLIAYSNRRWPQLGVQSLVNNCLPMIEHLRDIITEGSYNKECSIDPFMADFHWRQSHSGSCNQKRWVIQSSQN